MLITSACTDETDTFASKGTSLQLNVKTASIESRGLIESATLPDASTIGLALTDEGGTTYDKISYKNIKATASTGVSPQTWTLANDMLLSSTSGTLYGYYPYNSAVTDITQVPVTAGDTDYMYATPVTDLNDGNNSATLVMNHALAAIRLKIVRGTYTGTGAVTSVSVSGENIASSGTLNARTGALSSQTGAGTVITDNTAFTLSTTAKQTDQIIVPVSGTSAKPTFTVNMDDAEYTVTPSSVTFEQGSIYEYTLTVDSKGISLSDVKVGDWSYNDSGNPVIEAGYKITLAGNTDGIAFSNKVNNDGSVTITAVPVEGDVYVVNSVFLDEGGAMLEQSYNNETGARTILLSNITKNVTIRFSGTEFLQYADWVKVTYNVTDNSSVTQLLYSYFDIANVTEMAVLEESVSRTVAEPVAITPANTYQFSTTGQHTVYVKFVDMTEIPKCAFEYCTGLTEVTIPNSVTSIGDYAFGVCEELINVNFGSGLQSIGVWSFSECTGLTSVTIPNSVITIEKGAFQETGLISINIPNSVTSIGKYAFLDCLNLKKVIFADGNVEQTIGDYAFGECSNLTEVTISNSVTSIGESAFYECVKLKKVTIGSGVQTIGDWVFLDCPEIISIEVDENNSVYDSRNDCNAIIETATNTLIAGCKNTVIPNVCQSIGVSAFSGCTGLTSITIPEDCQSIGVSAFSGCTGLTSITIPEDCQSIGDRAFSSCSGLESVTISNSVQTIGNYAFSSCSGLTSITIPESVTKIGNSAFWNCSELQEVTIGSGLQEIGEDAFVYCPELNSIVVDKANTIYDTRNNCNAIMETATNTLISGCNNTVIPDDCQSIEKNAFWGCSGLKSITIPKSVKSIGSYAFCVCKELGEIISLATTAPSIHNYSFQSVKSNGTLIVPKGCQNAYNTWMSTSYDFLGKYGWTIQEITE